MGPIKGREGDVWQRTIVNKPIREVIEELSSSGFNGIYIDSFGYTDNGKEVISTLSSLLQIKPIVSENMRFYFFDLKSKNGY